MRGEVFTHKQFGLKRAEERFAHRIVIGITGRAHGRLHPSFATTSHEGNGGVLAPLIRMQDHAFGKRLTTAVRNATRV